MRRWYASSSNAKGKIMNLVRREFLRLAVGAAALPVTPPLVRA
jgi:hypothetical protein